MDMNKRGLAAESLVVPEDVYRKIVAFSRENIILSNDDVIKASKEIGIKFNFSGLFIDKIKDKVSKDGYLVLSGFPVRDNLPATPSSQLEYVSDGKLITECILIYVSSIFGMPKSYEQENNGCYIHNLYPVKGNEKIASGTGSEVDFAFHTEIAFDKNKPDFIILTAVRSRHEQNVSTTLVNLENVLGELTNRELEIIQEKKYFVRPPYSFSGDEDIYYRRALANFNGKKSFYINFNPGVICCCNKETENLFEKIERLCSEFSFEVCLSPGATLIIDNNKMLHGRSYFKPKYDGGDRWLQRIYVKSPQEA